MEIKFCGYHIPEKWSKVITMAVISIGVAFITASFTVLSSYYPIFALNRNIPSSQIGWIFAAFQIGLLAFGPFVSILSTYVGTKYTCMWSILICAVATLLFSFTKFDKSNTSFVAISIMLRIFQGVGFFGVQSSSITIAAELYPNDLSKAVSVIEIANGIGFASGPPMGGIFYQLLGFMAPTVFLSALNFVMFIVMCSMSTKKVDKQVTAIEDKTNVKSSLLKILRIPKMYLGLLTLALFTMSYIFFDISISPYLNSEFGLQQYEIGLMFTALEVIYGFTGPVVGYFVDRYNISAVMMTIGPLIYGTSYFFMGPAIELDIIKPELWKVVLSFMFNGLACSFMYIPTMAYFLSAARENDIKENSTSKSLLSGFLSYGGGIGGVIGPIVGGMLLEKMRFTQVCYFFSGINFIWFVVMFLSILISRIFGTKLKDRLEYQPL